ncbi:hypothetical protein ACIBJF_35265 [Streptomyces sp. NPDC050743]|uniref:hypothetical protein n=1 Tax=Streptomyces sp. NPDC050743 TaxID=3365634 RepID=UPI0037AEB70E
MHLIRGVLAAATVAASTSAVGLAFFADWMPRSADATQVRMVSAAGLSRGEAESSQSPSTEPVPQQSALPCWSYGGPYCGWVGTYWGGCDEEWGLSFGFKNPDWLCPHDPLPSPSASLSPSGTSASSGGDAGINEGSNDSSVTLSRLAKPHHSAKPHYSAKPSPTARPSVTAPPSHLGDVSDHPIQLVLPTGSSERPPAISGGDAAHPSVAVEPQVMPSAEDVLGSRPERHTGAGRPVPDREPVVAGQLEGEDG